MFWSYFTVAWRSMRRNAGTTVLNVVGLTAGLASCMLIGLWVHHELSYDDFHPNAERTYRIVQEYDLPDLDDSFGNTPAALAPWLEASDAGVAEAVRTVQRFGTVSRADRAFVEDRILFADDGLFDVFDFAVTRGAAALDRPETVLLTPKTAAKYFPNSDPIGQTLQAGPQGEMEVTGIVAPPPGPSTIQYDLIASLEGQRGVSDENWGRNAYETYVMLQKGGSAADLSPALENAVQTALAPRYEEALGQPFPDGGIVMHAQPLTGIYLGTGVPVDIPSEGNRTYVLLFGALAVFVLVLACINFMNLSTARSAQRANEVGVRKAMGAHRKQLAAQFAGESILMTLMATVLALGTCVVALPAFNALAGTSIAWGDLLQVKFGAALVGLVGVTGLLAGSYPAFVLSRFAPLQVLRGQRTSSEGSARLRQGLVVFQFAVSIALIAGTVVVHQQVAFMQTKGLGFNQEDLVVIERSGSALGPQEAAFEEAVASLSSVQQVSSAFTVPGSDQRPNSMWQSGDPESTPRNFDFTAVGPGYIETMEIEMVAGRSFSADRSTDSSAVVLNEAAARQLGWTPAEAIGRVVQRPSGDASYEVIGVTQNFHYESLETEVYPLLLFQQTEDWQHRYVVARTQAGGTQNADVVDAIHGVWGQFADIPPETSLLADRLAAQYRAETRLQQLFSVLAGLAILIACLGLFGLASYAAQQRVREIGIRKALGATATQIIARLSADFLKLVALAFVVGAPLAYLGMERWLERFAYRIDLGLATLVAAGALALLVAAATVSTQAWRAARTDPATALRTE